MDIISKGPPPVTHFHQTEPHLLKTEQSLKIVAEAGEISIQNISLWKILQIKKKIEKHLGK